MSAATFLNKRKSVKIGRGRASVIAPIPEHMPLRNSREGVRVACGKNPQRGHKPEDVFKNFPLIPAQGRQRAWLRLSFAPHFFYVDAQGAPFFAVSLRIPRRGKIPKRKKATYEKLQNICINSCGNGVRWRFLCGHIRV